MNNLFNGFVAFSEVPTGKGKNRKFRTIFAKVENNDWTILEIIECKVKDSHWADEFTVDQFRIYA